MNNVHICYKSVANVVQVAGPSSIFVADFDILHAPEFQIAREKGAKLYAYRRPISRIDAATGPRELDYYMGDLSKVPLWGKGRRNNDYSTLTDLRVGSVWVGSMVEDMGQLIHEGICDGAFLDVLGGRPWGKLAAWDSWPAAERAQWTAGAVDAVRRLHEERNAVDELFELVCNNFWFLPPNDPSAALVRAGDQYCNGVCFEHHSPTSPFHTAYAARPFGALPRRVLAIAQSPADAKAWAAVPGVTHVCAQTQYVHAEASLVPFQDTRLEEAEEHITRLKSRLQSDTSAQFLEQILYLKTANAGLNSDLAAAHTRIANYSLQVTDLGRKVADRDVRIANAMRELQP